MRDKHIGLYPDCSSGQIKTCNPDYQKGGINHEKKKLSHVNKSSHRTRPLSRTQEDCHAEEDQHVRIHQRGH